MKSHTLAAGVAALALSGVALAQADVAAFYKGKTVHVIAPSGAGGSVYQYALLYPITSGGIFRAALTASSRRAPAAAG
jgi:hypothetical protein